MIKKGPNESYEPSEVPEEYPLSDLEDVFVDQYLIDLNAGQAWQRARGGQGSIESAYVQACRALQQPNVIRILNERREAKRKRAEISQDRVVAEIAKVAFADMGIYAAWGESGVILKNSETMSDDQRVVVKKISEGKFGATIELHDKLKALEMLGRHLGLFKDHLEVTGKDGKPIGFEVAYQQACMDILDEVNGRACGIPKPVGNRPVDD